MAAVSLPVSAEDQHDTWQNLLRTLNRQSVAKHFDAYTDVGWDDPEFGINPADSRWQLGTDHPLGGTAWYRSRSRRVRARMGLHVLASQMKVGLEFENVLQRGLLEWSSRLPNRSREFRYACHEIIEEGQHSLMFQEFINRTGLDVCGLSPLMQRLTRGVVLTARMFPELFFVFVLGGEEPIDYVQRETLHRGVAHPLAERIMRIHVTEEARHLSFAHQYLKRRVPQLSWLRRQELAVEAPFVLTVMAQLMLRPPSRLVRQYRIPRSVMARAYSKNPAYRAHHASSLSKVRQLFEGIGLITPVSQPIWRALGIWGEARASSPPKPASRLHAVTS